MQITSVTLSYFKRSMVCRLDVTCVDDLFHFSEFRDLALNYLFIFMHHKKSLIHAIVTHTLSLQAEVSHDEAKMPRRERPLLAGNHTLKT